MRSFAFLLIPFSLCVLSVVGDSTVKVSVQSDEILAEVHERFVSFTQDASVRDRSIETRAAQISSDLSSDL